VPGPLPVETLERLRALGDRAVFVRGNGDRWVVDAFDAPGAMSGEGEHPARPWAAWTAEAIDRRHRDLLASFAQRAVLDVDGLGRTLFCHGAPRDDEELLTALTRSAAGARRSRRGRGGRRMWSYACAVRPPARTVAGRQRRRGGPAVLGPRGRLLAAARPRRRAPAHRLRPRPRHSRDAHGRQPGHRPVAERVAAQAEGPCPVAELFERQADAH
jgi:hypothetical protein